MIVCSAKVIVAIVSDAVTNWFVANVAKGFGHRAQFPAVDVLTPFARAELRSRLRND